MTITNLSEIAAREIVKGFHGKFVHTDHVTVSIWEIDAGAVLPEHAHPHEQITVVISGQLELTVGGEPRVLENGLVMVIPGNTPHSGRALTACTVFDVFYPAREDYR